MDTVISSAIESLRSGGALLYPTDTIWGLGCDARNAAAVDRIYSIKQRDHTKSMLLLIAEPLPTMLESEPTDRPTTFILPHSLWRPWLGELVADNLPAADGSLGLRVPHHPLCQALLRQLGAPIVSTSANFSGRPSPSCFEEIDPQLIQRVDYCIEPRPEWISGEKVGSRIVKLTAEGYRTVIRP